LACSLPAQGLQRILAPDARQQHGPLAAVAADQFRQAQQRAAGIAFRQDHSHAINADLARFEVDTRLRRRQPIGIGVEQAPRFQRGDGLALARLEFEPPFRAPVARALDLQGGAGIELLLAQVRDAGGKAARQAVEGGQGNPPARVLVPAADFAQGMVGKVQQALRHAGAAARRR
jgi:hypothetical protein